VIVLESMKMELHVDAPFDATVDAIRCTLGEMVARGAVLAEVRAEGASAEGPGAEGPDAEDTGARTLGAENPAPIDRPERLEG
jgi:pyruvate/2-oxoglutarate dehydrogenase complex dihydrolipoamide acyltransferase (E2) component